MPDQPEIQEINIDELRAFSERCHQMGIENLNESQILQFRKDLGKRVDMLRKSHDQRTTFKVLVRDLNIGFPPIMGPLNITLPRYLEGSGIEVVNDKVGDEPAMRFRKKVKIESGSFGNEAAPPRFTQ